MSFLKTLLKRRPASDNKSGATVIEYCLIAGIIGLAIIGGATAAGNATNGAFNRVNTGFTGATT